MIMMTNMTTVSTQKIEREIPSKKVKEKVENCLKNNKDLQTAEFKIRLPSNQYINFKRVQNLFSIKN